MALKTGNDESACEGLAQSTTTNTGHRVLLVDDSSTLRKLITRSLESTGCYVDTAEDAKHAIENVAERAKAGTCYDLILMDVVMPGMHGTDATHLLREKGCASKIVIFTAQDRKFDMAASLCAGADDYLPKPFSPDDLQALLNCTPVRHRPA